MPTLNSTESLSLKKLLATRQSNHGLPRQFYHDELLYRTEMEAIWRKGWLFAGHSCQIPNPGDYFLYDIEGDSIIVLRGDDGQVNALHNVCRHRGTMLCREAEGNVKRLVCPYHQWTYDRSGRLVLQNGMQEGLDKSELGLHRAHAGARQRSAPPRPAAHPRRAPRARRRVRQKMKCGTGVHRLRRCAPALPP
jgi:Rieske 2Fe-2S family protein